MAQHISVSVPSRVSTGENFRLSYSINTSDVEDYRVGNFPSGLELIAGPYTSRQSSFSMTNGHMSSSSSLTVTYTLYAAKPGTYSLPPLRAYINGRWVQSRGSRVVISGAAQPNGTSAPRNHQSSQHSLESAGTPISGKDLFIKVSANKRRVHEQEPVLLTYKVYTTVDLTQLQGKMPDLTGFHTQEVPLPQQKSFHMERVNGRNYQCVTWSQYVMYPQMTGKLTIPPITYKGIVVQQNRTVDPMEAFLNGGSGYVEVKKNIIAPGITIQVDPLPAKPAGFSGGVGRFNISAQLDHSSVKAGNPITLRVVVSGVGNLKLLKQPVVKFPKDFDKYDAKVTDKTKLTANGVEGNMIYDFLAVPRNEGKYTIPSIEFIYYDTQLNRYKTLRTQSFTIDVGKGDGSSASESFEDLKDKDIHPIKTGDTEQHPIDEFFFGSTGYWVALLIPLIAFIVLLIVFRKRAIENADIVKMRGKRANRIAFKHLRHARDLMFASRKSEFYEEVLHALWGYVSNKLNIPVEKLSRDNIAETLSQHGVGEETVQKFINALDECEYERFAPGDTSGNMSRTFESAMTAIEDIENYMKMQKKRKHKAAPLILILTLLSLLPLSAQAITKQNADAEYLKGNYHQAIKDYEELLHRGASADIYYNLGNAYFRTQDVTHAVLNYERALLLSPGDKDIKFNLEFARARTIDQIAPQSEMFFITWYKALVNFTSVDTWATTAIVSIIAALLLMLIYLFGPSLRWRKVGFFGGCVFLVLFLLSNLFAYQQKNELINRRGAIIMSSSVNVKKTPARNSADAFILHEGTRVDITDKSLHDWRGIKLADGREGWIPTKQLEEI
jgi:tetratricopeptide (TPR) repeat protein